MKNPDAPFMELGLYFHDLDGPAAIEQLAGYYINRGARITHAYVASLADCPLTGYDLQSPELLVDDIKDFWRLLHEKSLTARQLVIEHGTQIVPSKCEYVVQLPISERAAEHDHSPVAIWVEGEAFSYPEGPTPAKARRVGAKALCAFRELVQALRPSYGSINFDYALECPADLRYDPGTLSFYDFYVARDFLGEEALLKISKLCPGAYHEYLDEGLITCTYEAIAPIDISVERGQAEELSNFVGQIIASR